MRELVLSPGSRSTPLVLASIAEKQLRKHVIIDERSAAFFALGLTRASGVPPALVCTSGTAPGHYLPAVMEASTSLLPMLILSADRPKELCDVGANQTTDQVKLFGSHVRHYLDIGRANEGLDSFRALCFRVLRAFELSRYPVPGPVHINVPLHKPLESSFGCKEAVHIPALFEPVVSPCSRGISMAEEALTKSKRPAFIAGPGPVHQKAFRTDLQELAKALGAPVIADATSQLKFTGMNLALQQAQLALDTKRGRELIDPDLLIQIGAPPIAEEKWFFKVPKIIITEQPWKDPLTDATAIIYGSVQESLQKLLHALKETKKPWLMSQTLHPLQHVTPIFGPGLICKQVIASLAPHSNLALANSNLIRSIDMFVDEDKPLHIFHHRGLSGIDGHIASAAGSSAVLEKPITLIIGDLCALHDMGSILCLKKHIPWMNIILINDRGGRIFERLPVFSSISRLDFETYFATKHELCFDSMASWIGADYIRACSEDELSHALQTPRNNHRIIEITLPPQAARDEITHAKKQASMLLAS